MMQKDTFWKLIEQSIKEKNSIDKNDQGDCLMDILTKYPIKDMVGFHHKLITLRDELDSEAMREIATKMRYKGNETAYQGYRNWVISLGQKHYEKAKKSPKYLLTLDDPNLYVVGRAYFPDLNFVASGAYYTLTDKEISDWEELIKTKQQNRLEDLSKTNNDKSRILER